MVAHIYNPSTLEFEEACRVGSCLKQRKWYKKKLKRPCPRPSLKGELWVVAGQHSGCLCLSLPTNLISPPTAVSISRRPRLKKALGALTQQFREELQLVILGLRACS
jgi:hypothetical protein